MDPDEHFEVEELTNSLNTTASAHPDSDHEGLPPYVQAVELVGDDQSDDDPDGEPDGDPDGEPEGEVHNVPESEDEDEDDQPGNASEEPGDEDEDSDCSDYPTANFFTGASARDEDHVPPGSVVECAFTCQPHFIRVRDKYYSWRARAVELLQKLRTHKKRRRARIRELEKKIKALERPKRGRKTRLVSRRSSCH